jgi:hypothetical protein
MEKLFEKVGHPSKDALAGESKVSVESDSHSEKQNRETFVIEEVMQIELEDRR